MIAAAGCLIFPSLYPRIVQLRSLRNVRSSTMNYNNCRTFPPMEPGTMKTESGDYDISAADAAAAVDRLTIEHGSCLCRDARAWTRTAGTDPVGRSQRSRSVRGCPHFRPRRCQLARIWADRGGGRWRPAPQIQPATGSDETMPRRLGRSKMMRQKPKMAACA